MKLSTEMTTIFYLFSRNFIHLRSTLTSKLCCFKVLSQHLEFQFGILSIVSSSEWQVESTISTLSTPVPLKYK